jgi:hypothetical protein
MLIFLLIVFLPFVFALIAVFRPELVEQLIRDPLEPKLASEMLRHLALTHGGNGFNVTVLDGTSYQAATLDFRFKDGMAIIADGQRIYIPKTAIKSIVIKDQP